jgi:hypothetical protein
MRPELEQIETIEKYLNGQLSAAERIAFESQLAADPALREALELQQDIQDALHRISLTAAIKHAKHRLLRNTWLRRGGFGLGAIIIATGIILFALRHSNTNQAPTHQALNPTSPAIASQPIPGQPSYHDSTLPAGNETGAPRWAAADSSLGAQTFWFNAGRDTVIRTSGGIVLSIPATAFLDPNNHPATGAIELTIKEALDPASIMKSGLSTRSGDRQLETGGMFFVDGRKDGQPLRIDPAHAIYAEIPTDSIRPGMQLFSGKRLSNGTIDWVNPKPLEHNLLAVDIQTLNFYPPHYLDSLASWGYDRSNRRFTDSLYYSLASWFATKGKDTGIEGQTEGIVDAPKRQSGTLPTAAPADSTRTRDTVIRRPKPAEGDMAPDLAACGINPAKIKAIWHNNFNNTLIATREFEQRIIYIHQSADSSLLDLYLDHLDLDLWTIDSLAARQTTGALRTQFRAFAARHDGHVLNGDTRFATLRRYYYNRSKAFTEAIAKTQREFWDKQQQLDSIVNEREAQNDKESFARLTRNFREELNLNLRSALFQLGYDTTTTETRGSMAAFTSPTKTYNATIITTGWCNVDRYTYTQTSLRETIDYTDTKTSKRAKIIYEAASFEIKDFRQYDRVNVYLLPDKLNSFMRLNADSSGTFTEKLNSEMTYRLAIIGYKKSTTFFFVETGIQPAMHRDIPLAAIDKATLDRRILTLANPGPGNTSNTQANDLINEQGFIRFDIRDQPRRKHNQDLRDLTDKLLQTLFPCYLR